MRVITPSTPLSEVWKIWHLRPRTIFLGGSIEMDRAERWQDQIILRFAGRDIWFTNPRRYDWDNNIVQSKK